MSETDFSLPPPTFEFLIFSLKMQAEMRLGLLPMGALEDNPEDKDEEPDLPGARHAIDIFDTRQGQAVGQIPVSASALWLSSNGAQVISGGQDGVVRIWQVSDGSLFRSLAGHKGAVRSLAGNRFNAKMRSHADL